MTKKILIVILLIFKLFSSQAQSTCPIDEHFDITNTFTSTGTPGWSIDSNYSVTSPNSIRGQFGPGINNAAELTSASVSTVGSAIVKLKFKHICKLNFFDGGFVQINTGSGWVFLTAQNTIYTGTAVTFTPGFGYSFKALSYPLLWQPSVDSALPDNSWWKAETFDISAIAANQPNIQIRFLALDSDLNGMVGNYGWLIDDVQLCHSTCELDPPSITPIAPLLIGNVYNPGPYTVCFDMTDSSSIIFSELYYNLNNTSFQATGSMSQLTSTKWCGAIPITTLNVGDTVRWYIEAYDGSCNFNIATFPSVTPNVFTYYLEPPIPFCDYFDSPSQFWKDTSISVVGSHWELGVPNCGLTNSPLTFPNSWTVGLNGPYQSSSHCLLTSGNFDFTYATSIMLSFWYNYDTEYGHDGVRLQYSTDGGFNWLMIGHVNDSCGKNWYNGTISGGDSWTGITNGWTKASYGISCIPGINGSDSVRFRFEFISDNSIISGCGFSLDNLCFDLVPDTDVAVVSIDSPRRVEKIGSSRPVKVTVENAGGITQNTFTLVTTIKTGAGTFVANMFPWTGTIYPGQRINVTLPSIIVPSGNNRLCVYVVLPGDANPSNDMACKKLKGGNPGPDESKIIDGDDFAMELRRVEDLDNFELADEEIRIFPNPVNDILTIIFYNAPQQKFLETIQSVSGATMYKERRNAEDSSIETDLVNLDPGIYILTLDFEGRQFHRKFIKN